MRFNGSPPGWGSPPGDTIADLLEEKGLDRRWLAEKLDLSKAETKQLLRGEKKISQGLANKLHAAFDVPVEFWLKREENYRRSR